MFNNNMSLSWECIKGLGKKCDFFFFFIRVTMCVADWTDYSFASVLIQFLLQKNFNNLPKCCATWKTAIRIATSCFNNECVNIVTTIPTTRFYRANKMNIKTKQNPASKRHEKRKIVARTFANLNYLFNKGAVCHSRFGCSMVNPHQTTTKWIKFFFRNCIKVNEYLVVVCMYEPTHMFFCQMNARLLSYTITEHR